MSDIDFDELDRAVNGALGISPSPSTPQQPAQQQPVAPQPIAPSLTIPAAAEAERLEHVERTQLNFTASHPTPAPLASVAPAARRSSGRFMDMVHPSSDMRSRGSTPPTETHLSVIPAAQPIPAVATVTESPAWNEPLESPFLPDTKVEKRPLGGTVNERETIPEAFDFQGLLDESDDEGENTPVTPAVTVELEEELLEAPEPQERIEANAMPDPIDFATGFTEPDDIESKLNEVEAVEAEEPTSVRVDEPAPIATMPLPAARPTVQPVMQAVPAIEEPIGPTSITPQYKEQPSSNQESGAIYDTESYHQAVSVPMKKKSGWTTLIWILILIVLGAAAGWAVYTYVLPMI